MYPLSKFGHEWNIHKNVLNPSPWDGAGEGEFQCWAVGWGLEQLSIQPRRTRHTPEGSYSTTPGLLLSLLYPHSRDYSFCLGLHLLFTTMSRVARLRRHVSEDPDIDNLLSTLSPEEMEQLEKELDAGDPDAGQSAGLSRDQTERASSQREAERESQRLAQAAPQSGKSSEKEDKVKETRKKDPAPTKKLEDANDTKTRAIKDTVKPKDDRVSKMRERFRQEKSSSVADKEKVEKTASKKLDEEKGPKEVKKDKAENLATEEKVEKKIAEKIEKKEVAEVQAENKLDKKKNTDKLPEKKEKSESVQASKSITQDSKAADQEKKNMRTTEPQRAENGSKNTTEENKDDESSSIFDELLEKVKNNEAELTELNLNNSDCITIETLMSFTEALEFNTVVKIFSLANTRADDHIAMAIAAMLKSNKTITSINLDSNHITGKGILAIFRALQHNDTLTELRFHNQRHICGGKTEMEIAKILKENTAILKLGYHFELAGPRMTVTNLLSRNMDKQRQRRMAEQKALKEAENKKNCLEVPKVIPPPKEPPKLSGKLAVNNPQKSASKKGGAPVPPPPPPPMAPLAPPLINENIRNSLSPASQRRIVEKPGHAEKNTRDKLLESIRSSNIKQLKKVEVPKWLK
ncbi:leiomodin-1 [Hyla sarda]|uniref:leiomodin-1 n=1 Tax=Hyla sarda TaxID=327740 RepID=UPI0024C2458F|nr:leiomodin-1 [Hyla sarda]